jgi:hypothetical protein
MHRKIPVVVVVVVVSAAVFCAEIWCHSIQNNSYSYVYKKNMITQYRHDS